MEAELAAYARKTAVDKLSFLKIRSLFANLIECTEFTGAYTTSIDALYSSPSDIKNVMNSALAAKRKLVAGV